jgi:hypothetical protein
MPAAVNIVRGQGGTSLSHAGRTKAPDASGSGLALVRSMTSAKLYGRFKVSRRAPGSADR